MSEKIKIVLKARPISSDHTPPEKIKLKPKEIQPKPHALETNLETNLENLDHNSYLKHFFIKPLKKLIENEGVHEGVLIAQVCALEIMEKMFDSLLNKNQTSVTEILYEAAFADYQVEEFEEVSNEVEEVSNEVEEDDENQDDDDQEEDDEEDENEDEITDDYDYESDMEEARECESYMGGYEDESMDG